MTDREVMQQALVALEAAEELAGKHDAQLEYGFHQTITALKAALEQQAEPTPWRDMVVVSLVREGIDKHRARELADHFAAQPEPPPEWVLIKNILDEYGLDAIAFVAEWKAAQRPWVGLTDEDWAAIGDMPDAFDQGVAWAAARLKERNT
jgi:hypothetical protein